MNFIFLFDLDLDEKEKCLKDEGIPDFCLISFKTLEGHEICNDWAEKNRAVVMKSEARWKNCVNASSSDL